MSVYKPKDAEGKPRSPFYLYDFQYRGQRFHGSTGCTTERQAKDVEHAEKDEAKRQARLPKAGASGSLLLDHVAGRYWEEVGKHHAGSENTDRDLERLVDYFGKTKLITEIDNNDVARLVAWRRSQRAIPHNAPKDHNPEDYPFVSPATVNRSTTEVLKKLFTRARDVWDVTGLHKIKWNEHLLDEPEERVRELQRTERNRLEAAMRDDYAPFFDFLHATGLRRDECVHLRWSEVNWESKQIVKLGKGGKKITAPITKLVAEILKPLVAHHDTYVFTYVAARSIAARSKGKATRQRNIGGAGQKARRSRQSESRMHGSKASAIR